MRRGWLSLFDHDLGKITFDSRLDLSGVRRRGSGHRALRRGGRDRYWRSRRSISADKLSETFFKRQTLLVTNYRRQQRLEFAAKQADHVGRRATAQLRLNFLAEAFCAGDGFKFGNHRLQVGVFECCQQADRAIPDRLRQAFLLQQLTGGLQVFPKLCEKISRRELSRLLKQVAEVLPVHKKNKRPRAGEADEGP